MGSGKNDRYQGQAMMEEPEGGEEQADDVLDPGAIPGGSADDSTDNTDESPVSDEGPFDESMLVPSREPDFSLDFDIPNRTTGTELPYIFRRSNVTKDREQIGIQGDTETKRMLRRAEIYAEEHFDGDSVQATDVREAVVLAGMANPGAVLAILEMWGYGSK